ncbi:MAG: GTP 3',8-cyclase MoaA [Desulfurococcaceae archaeon]
MTTNILIDPYGRTIDNLRVLVTSKCNYKCIFCHGEGLFYTPLDAFNADDYEFIAKTASKIGIKYYKLTGGEPLVREDISSIVENIKPYALEVSLVTNGSLLLEKAKELAEAGLDRLNVSLHSLSEKTYEYITGGSKLLNKVILGIDEAIKYGLKVKLNFLVMKSNISEFKKIVEFAESRGLNINVIALIPLGVPRSVYEAEHVSIDSITRHLEERSIHKYYRELQHRPVYVLESGIKVEVVIGYENYLFCGKCSRIRLTPDGYLKPCLYVEEPRVSIVDSVKKRDEEKLINAFKEITKLRKPYFMPRGVIGNG